MSSSVDNVSDRSDALSKILTLLKSKVSRRNQRPLSGFLLPFVFIARHCLVVHAGHGYQSRSVTLR